MKRRSTTQQTFGLLGWIALTALAPAAGAFWMPGAWYAALAKPEWNPPNWIFGPVWSVLYLGMAVAAWLVWRRGSQGHALKLYVVQLALNAAWTPVFFGAHQLGAALLVILALWLAIVLTLRAFWRVSTPAGLLFVSYLAWVSFASFLNFTLWRMNP
ncbi:MAG: TspO/MBR family protein [Verrucomicrobiota bacterium]